MKIVEWIIDKGAITNREIIEMFNISSRAALDEITNLIDLNVVKSV